jgi:hypothetical protein
VGGLAGGGLNMALRLAGLCFGMLLILSACNAAEPTPPSPPTSTLFAPTLTPSPSDLDWLFTDRRVFPKYSILVPSFWAVSEIGDIMPFDINIAEYVGGWDSVAPGVVLDNSAKYLTWEIPWVLVERRGNPGGAHLWISATIDPDVPVNSLGTVTNWIQERRMGQAKVLFDKISLDTVTLNSGITGNRLVYRWQSSKDSCTELRTEVIVMYDFSVYDLVGSTCESNPKALISEMEAIQLSFDLLVP